jgi:sigma-B regulation protein RsbU (phosphoserine phosphatase)
MSGDGLLWDTAEDLYENAPCGYLSTRLDGTIVRVNRTFERWTGLDRADLLAGRRFQDLLSAGARIFHETHYAPLLRMQGAVREIALDIVRADGSILPALVNSVVSDSPADPAEAIRTMVFDATDRRRYEQELLSARRREQNVARELQRSLLSGTLPRAPGLAIDVAYRPAEKGLEAGGDWYDAFWLDDSQSAVGLVVGDVVGRGLTAAATMGQLRSAVRALAGTGLGPGRLLAALDSYARRHAVGRMATVVYAEFDLRTRTLRFACAGHPSPVIVAPPAAAAFAGDGRSLPLDAFLQPAGERPQASRRLTAGSTVILYTDGLVERRSRPLDDGMNALLAEITDRCDDAGEGGLAGGLAHALHNPGDADDVCVLAVHVG